MEWTPQNLIALAGVLVALLSLLSGAAVSVTATRRQQRSDAVDRRRDVHLRYWQASNAALHLLQKRSATMASALEGTDIGEAPELTRSLDDARAVYYELEIISPAVAPPARQVLTGLELAHAEVKRLEDARRRFAGHEKGLGGQIHATRRNVAAETDSVATLMDELRHHMTHHDRTGTELAPTWSRTRRKR